MAPTSCALQRKGNMAAGATTHVQKPSPAQMEAKKLPYYHPEVKNNQQVVKLMDWCKDINGSFLLRNSFNTQGGLTVSVWYERQGLESRLKHIKLRSINGSYYFEEDLFPTIDKLICFYANKDVPNEDGIYGLRLAFPMTNVFLGDFGAVKETRLDPFVVTVESQRRETENSSSCGDLSRPSCTSRKSPRRLIPLPPEEFEDLEDGYQICRPSNDVLPYDQRRDRLINNSVSTTIPSNRSSADSLLSTCSSVNSRLSNSSLSSNRSSNGSSLTGSDSAIETDDESIQLPTRKGSDKKKKFSLFKKR